MILLSANPSTAPIAKLLASPLGFPAVNAIGACPAVNAPLKPDREVNKNRLENHFVIKAFVRSLVPYFSM